MSAGRWLKITAVVVLPVMALAPWRTVVPVPR